ncbi:hypothetical protein EDC94DRAFT_518831, partial [Helicostylum pulchrum]
HGTSCSALCPNCIVTKAETVKMVFSKRYKACTTRLPYKRCVKETYKNILTTKVITTYRDIQLIVFGAKILVNYNILQHQDKPVPPSIFKQQFRYTTFQLVNASDCLTEVCAEIATSYRNTIVETFERNVLSYLKYKL